jgi:hypothetical protein
MTSEIVRDWDLRDLIELIEDAYDDLETAFLSDAASAELRDVGDNVLGTLGSAAEYLLELRDERMRVGNFPTVGKLKSSKKRRSA